MKKRVAIIGTVGLPASYGGFETLSEHLVEQLGAEYDFWVYCTSKKYPKAAQRRTYKGARLHYLSLDANGMQSIPYDTWSILHALRRVDVLLILGVSGAWILPFVWYFTQKRIIISIDGIEWKRDKWNPLAKMYLFWAEKMAVRYSHIDISDNESIQDYTAARYGSLSRIIEYGADHTLRVQPQGTHLDKYPFLKSPYAFKVCRIEPENNVHDLLLAFSQLPQKTLVVVGNWQNSNYGINLKQRYQQLDNIHLLDPIYDQEQLDLLRGNASLYIHGHSAGGTNPSLVEAMYLGLPIIAYNVSYNRTTTEGKARCFTNAEELRDVLASIGETERQQLGRAMLEIAERRYTWSHVARRYAYLIEEALATEQKRSVHPQTIFLERERLLELEVAHLKHQDDFYQKR